MKALVYVDAFIPDRGESLEKLDKSSCLAGNPADLFDVVPYPPGGPSGDIDTYIKQSVVPSCFATGLPAAQAAVMAAMQRPLAASALSETVWAAGLEEPALMGRCRYRRDSARTTTVHGSPCGCSHH